MNKKYYLKSDGIHLMFRWFELGENLAFDKKCVLTPNLTIIFIVSNFSLSFTLLLFINNRNIQK